MYIVLVAVWYTAKSLGYECDIAFIPQFDSTSVYKHKKQQQGVFKKPSFVQN